MLMLYYLPSIRKVYWDIAHSSQSLPTLKLCSQFLGIIGMFQTVGGKIMLLKMIR